MILKFLLVYKVHNLWRLLNLISLQDRQDRLVYRQAGLQLHHQQVDQKELKQEIHRVSDYTPHPRPSPPEPQLIPILMSDGEDDDDKPPQGERQRQRSRSHEQVYPHVQVLQVPQIQPMATPESDDEISDEDFTITNPSLSSAGTPPSAEQRIAPEEPKDLDHVTENIHVHPHMLVNNNSLLYLLSGE